MCVTIIQVKEREKDKVDLIVCKTNKKYYQLQANDKWTYLCLGLSAELAELCMSYIDIWQL